MLNIGIADAKRMFFDRDGLVQKTNAATRRALSKFGAFVRTRARSSIRPGKKPSAPGRPPRSHTGLLKKFIFFGYDPAAQSVVIGPARLNKSTFEALEALEYGGTSQNSKGKRIEIEERPFMTPAFAAELPKAPALWKIQ